MSGEGTVLASMRALYRECALRCSMRVVYKFTVCHQDLGEFHCWHRRAAKTKVKLNNCNFMCVSISFNLCRIHVNSWFRCRIDLFFSHPDFSEMVFHASPSSSRIRSSVISSDAELLFASLSSDSNSLLRK